MTNKKPPTDIPSTVDIPEALEGHKARETGIQNPHDAFFKAMMTDLRMARQFFTVHLPERFKSRCDFSTLRAQPDSFIEANLRQHLSDLLYSVQMAGQTSYLYCLVEHVTQAKPTTAFQVVRYQIAAMHHAMKQGHEKPPIVIPMVFYRGTTSPYPYSCDPFDSFEDPHLARETLLAPHILVDLSVIPDEELAHHKEIALMELLEKHITARDLRQLIRYLVDAVLRQYLTTDQFKSVVHYLEAAGFSDNYPAFFEEFNAASRQPNDKAMMQTLGDYLRQQGMQQGMQAGISKEKHDIAKNLHAMGLDATIIEQATGLSREEIDML
jgi:predicted transposase/invertase (TIGR01784 family)